VALAAGTRLGPYEILAAIGAGGMGEVYRARDTKLGRDVALKILPDAFASDPDRLARFTREAQTLAALNHPNIAHIHGLEESGGVRALVMELVEGEDLAERLVRGPIPLDEALPIAKQIAEAFEAAHEQGIIHRDLKPANIKVRADGTVKVLDFGLAKALDPTPTSSPNVTNSPTLSLQATRAGIILGTAAYMSPEQARGKPVDKRTDIWAFGCVLYEVLSGKRAFAGEDVTDTLAAIIRADPDWSQLPNDTPPGIRRLLRRCLEKDRKERLPDIGTARLEIKDALTAPVEIPLSAAAPRRNRDRLAWISALASVTLIAVGASLWARRPASLAPEIRTEINTPATADLASFALSPDGRQLVFVASGDGPSRLWLRSLATTVVQPLAGTDGAALPFWSPNGRSVAFFADDKLKRLDLGGGQPQPLATAIARGGAWNADGVILYTPASGSPLFRVSASGGQVVAVTRLDRQTIHRFPVFLPDGQHFLFWAQGTPDTSGIYLGSLDSPTMTRLTANDTAGAYLPSGWLAWVRAGTLMAQRFDMTRRALAGEPVTVADPVAVESQTSSAAFSVSATGLMAYRSGTATKRQLTWFDRSGKAWGSIGGPDENSLSSPSVSPDGRRVVVHRTVEGNTDLWLLDGTHTSRFTSDPALDRYPTWSPDGSQVVFESNRSGTRNLYLKASNGGSAEKLLVESPQDKAANDWSPDGRFLLYQSLDPQTTWDLLVKPIADDRKPWEFLKTNFNERAGRFSPDGRWVAYMSNESGRMEIYVRPFVDPAAAGAAGAVAGGRQVSTVGGAWPRWRPDARELYYLRPDGQMMAVPITAAGAILEPGTPVPLFQTHIYGGGSDNAQGWQYDVAPNGRFLINTVLDEAAGPITLLQNWIPPTGK
jgi:serine/threonine protein kinase/Tol biopolymer transport system component